MKKDACKACRYALQKKCPLTVQASMFCPRVSKAIDLSKDMATFTYINQTTKSQLCTQYAN